ncbi:MFS transporter [Pseudomonadota bacterium AL_CKDN230030165-1A_HGKHYDSX7]
MHTAIDPARPAAGRLLLAIGGVYAAQGVVGGLTLQALPAVMRDAGAALDQVGLMSLAILPWALKFLWAPALERWRLPAAGGAPRTRLLVTGGQALMSAVLLTLAFGMQAQSGALVPMLGLLALLAASVDIACDAHAVEHLAPARRGWGNAAQVGGSYLGMYAGAGVFVVLLGWQGWTFALAALAAMLGALTLPFFRWGHPQASGLAAPRVHRPSLAAAWARPAVRLGLLLTVVFQLGSRLAMGMTGPLLIDRGVSLADVGWFNGVGGVTAGVVGTCVGALLVRRAGAQGALALCLLAQTAGLSLFCALVFSDAHGTWLLASAVLKGGLAAAGFVALYAFLMGHASPSQAGVDFTLFQCADAAAAALCGVAGGALAQGFGYGVCFGMAAGAAGLALVIVPALARRMRPLNFSGDRV